ncbi:MAG: hypothetical protein ABIZ70_13510 [Gemmatimonadales bacterium]
MNPFGYLWAAPVSLIGCAVAGAALATGGRSQLVDGVLEVEGGLLTRLLPRVGIGMSPVAMTLGHVVIAVDAETLERTRLHERVHVAQTARWGFLFPAAYLLASAMIALRGGDPYRDNPFEAEARAGETPARNST